MDTPPDPFAQSFDSIVIERAPSPQAIESAFVAVVARDQPGYFLLDDADGRFIVDREMGVVMLRDEALLARERDAVYSARLRVVEPSGASYDLDLKLRVTGLVPQMVGAEDFGLSSEEKSAPVAVQSQPRAPHVDWARFAPAVGAQTTRWLSIHGAYGALLNMALPATDENISIAFAETLPAPSASTANWSL